MKLLERKDGHLVFSLGSREKVLLERVLTFYPLEPDPEATLTREGDESFADATALLHDAQREQRTDLGEWINRRLTEGAALVRSANAWRLTLDGQDADRLLQVLNELRVGAWNKLGRPDEIREDKFSSTPGLAPLYLIMTVAGQFQMIFVHALLGGSGPENLEQPSE